MLAIILISINTLSLSSIALDGSEDANHIESDDCCDDDHAVSEYDWSSLPNGTVLRATCPACTALGNDLVTVTKVCPGGTKFGMYCWAIITYCNRCDYARADDSIGPHNSQPLTPPNKCQKCLNLGCNKNHNV